MFPIGLNIDLYQPILDTHKLMFTVKSFSFCFQFNTQTSYPGNKILMIY